MKKEQYDLWKAHSEPVAFDRESVLERFQLAIDAAKEPPKVPLRIVSYTRYLAAKTAIENGASEHEAELILCGASPELADKMAKEQT